MEDSVDVKNKYLLYELRKLSSERDDILACRFEEFEPRLKGNAVNSGGKIEENQLNAQQNCTGPLHLKLIEPTVLPLIDLKNISNGGDLTSERHAALSPSSSSPLKNGGIKKTVLSSQLKVDSGNSELSDSEKAGESVKEYYSAAFRELAHSVASSYGDQNSKSLASGYGGLEQFRASFQEFSRLPTLSSTVSGVGGSPSDLTNALSPLPQEGLDLAHLDPSWSPWFTSTPRVVEDRVSIAFPIPCIGEHENRTLMLWSNRQPTHKF